MARKKEPGLENKNRERIAQTAKELFLKNGIENTTMNDLAKAVNMSKSTLYVYFKSREEVKNYLSLEAMEYFYNSLRENVDDSKDPKTCFDSICNVVLMFREKYPLNFQLMIEEICVDPKVLQNDEILRRIYETGEAVNQFLFQTIGRHLNVESEKELFVSIFSMWGKLYGIITLAENKEEYIRKAVGMTKEEFLQRNFQELYQSVIWREERTW